MLQSQYNDFSLAYLQGRVLGISRGFVIGMAALFFTQGSVNKLTNCVRRAGGLDQKEVSINKLTSTNCVRRTAGLQFRTETFVAVTKKQISMDGLTCLQEAVYVRTEKKETWKHCLSGF